MHDSKIIIFTPTTAEAAVFDGFSIKNGSQAGVEVSGVGMAEIAASVSSAAGAVPSKPVPPLALLAGIGGAYPGRGLEPGDCVAVASETVGDLGAVRDGNFMPLFQKEYNCPLAGSITSVRTVRSLTVNCIRGPSLADTGEFDLENMEGAAFFAVCSALGIPYLEVRAVSNMTTDPRGEWNIPGALDSLREGVRKIVGDLLSSGAI